MDHAIVHHCPIIIASVCLRCDPEVNSFAFDGLRPGVDMSSYPTPRQFVFGLNVTF